MKLKIKDYLETYKIVTAHGVLTARRFDITDIWMYNYSVNGGSDVTGTHEGSLSSLAGEFFRHVQNSLNHAAVPYEECRHTLSDLRARV